MRVLVKILIVVFVIAMSFWGWQTILAEDEIEEVFGTVKAVDRAENTITVTIVSTTAEGYAEGDEILIKGFPFDYLEKEKQLDAEITELDCVGVNFFLKEDFWEFKSLYAFCDDPETSCSDLSDICDLEDEIDHPGPGPDYKHQNRKNIPNN